VICERRVGDGENVAFSDGDCTIFARGLERRELVVGGEGFEVLPWFVPIPASAATGLVKDSGADAFQVKSISENRFIQRIGNVTSDQLDEIAAAIALCVDTP
jgi:hypothetical protein